MSQSSAQPSPPQPELAKRALRIRRLIVAGVIVLELAAGLLVVAAFGGFKSVPRPAPPLVRAGNTIDTKRFDIKPIRVWRYDYDPTQTPEWADKGRFLAVELDVSLTAKDSMRFSTELQQAMWLYYPDGFRVKGIDPKSVPLRKGTVTEKDRQFAQLHPGMPQRLLVVYQLPKQQPWPAHVGIDFLTWEYSEGFLDPTFSWRVSVDDHVAARVDMTVLKAEAPE